MKLHQFVIGTVAGLSLALTVQMATAQVTLDWKFNTGANPSLPDVVTGTTNAATATFLPGGNYTYFPSTGPFGLYGTLTGLWAMEKSADTAPALELKFDQTPVTTVDLTLVLTQFIDNSQFPGTVQFPLPGAVFMGRQTVQEQTGDMIGAWFADTYAWTGISFPVGDALNGAPITLALFPGLNSSGLLLDEVSLTIIGAVSTVPEPMCGQLAGLGLLLFGLRSWLRRRAQN